MYILATRKDGALYVGVTSNLLKRVWEHRSSFVKSFTSSYQIHRLVWYEIHSTMESAIQREKAIKRWKRYWKDDLIKKRNPDWKDLYGEIAY